MIDRKLVLHIIPDSKFTNGYIDYFLNNPADMKHRFVVVGGKEDHVNIHQGVVLPTVNYFAIRKYDNVVKSANKIIVSSFFSEATRLLFVLDKNDWGRTYIQFWGGDIYRFLKVKLSLKEKIDKALVAKCIKKAKELFTLVEGDYIKIHDIFNVEKPHRMLLVPDDFYSLNQIDYNSLKDDKKQNLFKILIGNSATPENQHEEVFNILNEKELIKTEIVVPLSYGVDKYREEVIRIGKQMFGDKFIPITEYMERNEYIRLLSRCDVAIFNNNRQQATGNITILINLNKKIYMRNDTTMWQYFKDLGLVVHDVQELKKNPIEKILHIDKKDVENNKNVIIKMEKEATNAWRKFLNE